MIIVYNGIFMVFPLTSHDHQHVLQVWRSVDAARASSEEPKDGDGCLTQGSHEGEVGLQRIDYSP